MKKLIAVTLTVVIHATLYAQNMSGRIDSMFSQKDYFNGGVLVSDHGQIIYHKSFGYADLSTGKRLDNNAAFQTASLSKVFTSTAILQLVGRKRIRLTDPVKKYLPDFPYPDITIRNLLTHTSGLPDVEIYDTLLVNNPGKIMHNNDLIPALLAAHKPLHFVPGTKFEYCNTGYQLLALLVEKVSGRSFSGYLADGVFKPAGMKHTFLRNGLQDLPVKNHTTWPMFTVSPRNVDSIAADPKQPFQKELYYDIHTMGATYGDQNIITTTGDLFLFARALLSGKLISRELVREAISPNVLNDGKTYFEHNPALGDGGSSYGLGWETRIAGNDTIIGHSGYNRGIYVQYYIDMVNARTIIMFDNTEGPFFLQKFLNIIALLNGQTGKRIDLRRSAVRLYGSDLLAGSSAAALIHLNEMRLDTANYRFTPQQMNQLGYDFLRAGYIDKALETFKINLLLYPSDFNRYDSYADALVGAGKTKEAILMYEKALSLNPNSSDTKRKLNKLR